MVHQGDLFDVLPTLEAECVSACITDPPYNLTSNKRGGSGAASLHLDSPADRSRITTGGGFMGQKWDGTGVAFRVETWQAIYRVMKPGAYLAAFGGTRTSHRMVSAIEDAGFEIRDTLCWLYGSGFPKSLDVSKAIDKAAGAERERLRGVRSGVVGSVYAQDAWSKEFKDSVLSSVPVTEQAKSWVGYGTALKPAWEPIILARKPTIGTVAANVLRHSTGALNIDACRIGFASDADKENGKPASWPTANDSIGTFRTKDRSHYDPDEKQSDLGRWPANVCLDEDAAEMLDAQSGLSASGVSKSLHEAYEGESLTGFLRGRSSPENQHGDVGGASRFYYVAKPSREERDFGCASLTAKPVAHNLSSNSCGVCGLCVKANGSGQKCSCGALRETVQRPRGGNHHPTVKPVELMRWLVKLVVPVNGVCLDPFTGSGTTGMACAYELRQFIGIEREAEYVELATRRIAAVAPLFSGEE